METNSIDLRPYFDYPGGGNPITALQRLAKRRAAVSAAEMENFAGEIKQNPETTSLAELLHLFGPADLEKLDLVHALQSFGLHLSKRATNPDMEDLNGFTLKQRSEAPSRPIPAKTFVFSDSFTEEGCGTDLKNTICRIFYEKPTPAVFASWEDRYAPNQATPLPITPNIVRAVILAAETKEIHFKVKRSALTVDDFGSGVLPEFLFNGGSVLPRLARALLEGWALLEEPFKDYQAGQRVEMCRDLDGADMRSQLGAGNPDGLLPPMLDGTRFCTRFLEAPKGVCCQLVGKSPLPRTDPQGFACTRVLAPADCEVLADAFQNRSDTPDGWDAALSTVKTSLGSAASNQDVTAEMIAHIESTFSDGERAGSEVLFREVTGPFVRFPDELFLGPKISEDRFTEIAKATRQALKNASNEKIEPSAKKHYPAVYQGIATVVAHQFRADQLRD